MEKQLRLSRPARAARRSFYLLVGLAGVTLAVILILFLSAPSPLMYVAELCYWALTSLGAQIYAWRWGFPASFLTAITFAFLTSIWHKFFSTRRRVQQILCEPCPLSPHLEQLAQEMGLAGRLRLIRNDQSVLFSYGLINPQVCLSTGLVNRFDGEELRAVLWHEQYHIRQRDPLRILAATALARALFFIPMIDELQDAYQRDKEIAADVEATERMGDAGPLARALLKVLATDAIEMPAVAVTAGALKVTQDRIAHLLNHRPTTRPISARGALASLAAILAISMLSLLPVEIAHARGIMVGVNCHAVEETSQMQVDGKA